MTIREDAGDCPNSETRIGVRRLAKYLPLHIDGFWGLTSARKFEGGQSNPTYLLDAGSGRYVLRSKPPGNLLGSAHAIDREYRLLESLKPTEVPVAKPLHYCSDPSVIGSEFYVMEYVQGRIFWNQALPDQNSIDRRKIFDEMNRCLAAIHSVDLVQAGLEDFGHSTEYYPRQLSRWIRQYRDSQTAFYADIEYLISWLKENMIADDGCLTLVHGDYRMDNLIWHPTKPEILAVIDWELSTLGHPLADLAFQSIIWSQKPGQLSRGLAGIERITCGIPTDEQYVQAYCRRMGIEGIENWNFHLAFAYFRIAAILQGVAKRAEQGKASSCQAKEYGKLVPDLARQGLEVALDADCSTDDPVEQTTAFGEFLMAS